MVGADFTTAGRWEPIGGYQSWTNTQLLTAITPRIVDLFHELIIRPLGLGVRMGALKSS